MYYYIVIDSFGIGADRRAAEYDDCGAHTAYHVSRAVPGPKWKFLQRLGLGNCCRLTDPAGKTAHRFFWCNGEDFSR